jgi:hypothetical protein
MRFVPLIVACFLVSTLEMSADDARDAVSKFDARISELRVERERQIELLDSDQETAAQLARQELLVELEALRKLAMAEDKLDQAVAIKKQIAEYEQLDISRLATEQEERITSEAKSTVFENHSYFIYRDELTWHLASQFAAKKGGHLLRIESPEEYEFVATELLRRLRDGAFHMDGSDETEEGKWLYSDGSPVPDFVWAPIEPNNVGDTEHSLGIGITSNGWGAYDGNGGMRRPFIVEWDGRRGEKVSR